MGWKSRIKIGVGLEKVSRTYNREFYRTSENEATTADILNILVDWLLPDTKEHLAAPLSSFVLL